MISPTGEGLAHPPCLTGREKRGYGGRREEIKIVEAKGHVQGEVALRIEFFPDKNLGKRRGGSSPAGRRGAMASRLSEKSTEISQ